MIKVNEFTFDNVIYYYSRLGEFIHINFSSKNIHIINFLYLNIYII